MFWNLDKVVGKIENVFEKLILHPQIKEKSLFGKFVSSLFNLDKFCQE